MRYEIITDKDDLLVLVVNSRVVAISREMSEIMRLIVEDYSHHTNKKRRVTYPALMHPELDDDMYKEEEIVQEEVKKPKLSEGSSLGSLLGM